MSLAETDLRDLLDAQGLLDAAREPAFPSNDVAFIVFSQRANARIDAAEWGRYAERFLGARLGLTVEKRYDVRVPSRDVARVVLAPLGDKVDEVGAPSGTRVCWSRPRTEEDVRAARRAELAGAGLADLAQRCPQVWLVEVEAEEDPVSLRLAATLAGVMLGPILSPRGASLFGPKTARERLFSV
jgi:hypothetical protein